MKNILYAHLLPLNMYPIINEDKKRKNIDLVEIDNKENLDNSNKSDKENLDNSNKINKNIIIIKKRKYINQQINNLSSFVKDDNKSLLNLSSINPDITECANKLYCDHKLYDETWYSYNKIIITDVNTLDDLINLGKQYHCKMRVEYNGIDMQILFNLINSLTELNNMIGLNNIKSEIVNNIIYFLLMQNSSKHAIQTEMLHAVITGSPGCGKTTFIEILAKIYVKIGILKRGQIIKVRRSDLIGKYLGHTAAQTQKKIDDAKGGILLIDEAYSLGNPDGKDSFAKECIDTLNQALSEQYKDFICIIAGYKDALETSFFSYNEGLKRRFPFRYDIEKYSSDELAMILLKRIYKYDYWTLDFTTQNILDLIKEYYKKFHNQGGDMESIFLNMKIAHNKRIFLLPIEEKKILKLLDIKTAINKFIAVHKLNEDKNYNLNIMYL